LIPFIDTEYFDIAYGDTQAGERIIDAQFASSTKNVSLTMNDETLFGVNFADGRIKGYGLNMSIQGPSGAIPKPVMHRNIPSVMVPRAMPYGSTTMFV
jgi:hypothetical protein